MPGKRMLAVIDSLLRILRVTKQSKLPAIEIIGHNNASGLDY